MKFQYLGKNENMTAFGYDFSKGQTPDVTDNNAIKRLSGNSHFAVVEEDKRPNVAATLEMVKAATTVEALDALAVDEDRQTVITAIEKKKAALTA